MREQVSVTISRLVIFIFVFSGYTCLFFIKPVAADGAKQIKAHPHAQKESLPSIVDLKAKVEEYNTRAIDLFEEGRYVEAQELWEKAVELMEHPRSARFGFDVVVEEQQPPESSDAPPADESLEVSPIDAQYQSGLSLLEQKEYGEAQKVFQEIDLMQPDYRNTKKYLVVIDELLREEDLPTTQGLMSDEPESQTAADYEEYPAMAQESRGADAGSEFDHREEEAQWEEAVEEAEQKILEQIAERVEPIYQRALQQYKSKEYVEARRSFEEVQVLSPDYKLTSKYLDGIDDDILYARQQQEEAQQLAEDRARRQDEQESRKTIAAKEETYRKELAGKAEEIYRQAFARAVRREKTTRERARPKVVEQAAMEMPEPEPANVVAASTEVSAKEEFLKPDATSSVKARELFQDAVSLYASSQFVPAREKFLELERLQPGYKTTPKYLAWIEEALVREAKKAEREKQRQDQETARIAAKEKAAQKLAEKNKLKIQRAEENKRQRLLNEAERKYGQAVIAYAKKDFTGAKQKFIEVGALYPEFKETTQYLSRVDADIAAQNQKPKEVVAAPIYVQPQRDIAKEQDRLKAEELFDQGVRLYGSNQLVPSREKFQEVDRLVPDYKTTRKYFQRIDQALAKDQKKAERIKQKQDKEAASRIARENAVKQKQEARDARLKANAQKARDKAEEAHQVEEAEPEPKLGWVNPPDFDALDPGQDAAALRRQYARIQKERKNLQATIQTRIAQTYAQAVQLYKLGHYTGAKNLFNEIAAVQPSFKGTKDFLIRIDQKLAKSPAAVGAPKNAVVAPSVYVKPRVQVVSDILDSLEAPRQ